MSAADWNHVDDRGHCVHCGDQSHCQLQQHRTQDALVGWLAACCPYNAEAKRIAVGIQARMDRAQLRDRFEVGYARGLHYALGVVEGHTVD